MAHSRNCCARRTLIWRLALHKGNPFRNKMMHSSPHSFHPSSRFLSKRMEIAIDFPAADFFDCHVNALFEGIRPLHVSLPWRSRAECWNVERSEEGHTHGASPIHVTIARFHLSDGEWHGEVVDSCFGKRPWLMAEHRGNLSRWSRRRFRGIRPENSNGGTVQGGSDSLLPESACGSGPALVSQAFHPSLNE